MGLDNIIEKDPEWRSSINYILIKNNICRTMKEINDSLNKSIDDKIKNNKPIFEDYKNNNINYKKAEEIKKKKIEEDKKKNKPKINNNNYNLILNFVVKCLVIKLSKMTIFNNKNYKKLKIY